jgi:hypothetical protein
MRRTWLATALLLILGAGCTDKPVSAGLYYWKTVLDWSSTDTQRLEAAGIGTVGLRVFDWGLRGAEGPLVVRRPLPLSIGVVPVAYVTVARLESWARDPRFQPEAAAAELLGAMDLALSPAWPGRPRVWQLDADWAASTRDAWFAVVRAVADRVHARGATLEVTVRLHQVRDRNRQGVPPADAGVLMVYGAGDTVLDPASVEAYTKGSAYPLPLTPAFPVYTQVRQLNGYGRLVGLYRLSAGGVPEADLRPLGGGRWEVFRRTSLDGRPLLAHDTLVVDGVEARALETVWNLPAVAAARRSTGGRIWIFDYDPDTWDETAAGPLGRTLFPR